MALPDGVVGCDQLHHFVGAVVWDAAPLERELARQADAMLGGDEAFLIVDDTALPKKGTHSVGVAPQYASALGKNAYCQTLVSSTLASREVPAMVGLRQFLSESWTGDEVRLAKAGVPEHCRIYRTKPEIAIEEIDRLRAGDKTCVGALVWDGSSRFRRSVGGRGAASSARAAQAKGRASAHR